MTGETRDRMREPRRAARFSRTFSQSLAAVEIAEPLASIDDNQTATMASALMESEQLSVLGVRHSGRVHGWVTRGDLTYETVGECAREFSHESVVDGSTGLDIVLQRLADTEHLFVEWLGEKAAVITTQDIQKPPVRMWLFGAVTVLDANMTWAIGELYPGDSWRDCLSEGRVAKAEALLAERRRVGSQCRLVECLQMSDKSAILTCDRAHIEALGFPSRREAERLMRSLEMLRNHLAHSQALEREHMIVASRLAYVIHSILRAEGAQRLIAVREQNGAPP